MFSLNCPIPEDHLVLAVRNPTLLAGASLEHLSICPACREVVSRLQVTAGALYAGAASSLLPACGCLHDGEIAALSEGVGGALGEASMLHLVDCAPCRHRLATVTRLLRDDAVTTELRRIGATAPRAVGGGFALRAAAAAAAVAAVLVGIVVRPKNTIPPSMREGTSPHRESAITTTIAPQIVGPAPTVTNGDSLRWTSVPHADRYQVMVFDRAGTLVWSPQTSDTTLALPPRLNHVSPTTYLWKVEARTSWDRWVGSEWEQFTLTPTSPQ